jgi:hypothetical protein
MSTRGARQIKAATVADKKRKLEVTVAEKVTGSSSSSTHHPVPPLINAIFTGSSSSSSSTHHPVPPITYNSKPTSLPPAFAKEDYEAHVNNNVPDAGASGDSEGHGARGSSEEDESYNDVDDDEDEEEEEEEEEEQEEEEDLPVAVKTVPFKKPSKNARSKKPPVPKGKGSAWSKKASQTIPGPRIHHQQTVLPFQPRDRVTEDPCTFETSYAASASSIPRGAHFPSLGGSPAGSCSAISLLDSSCASEISNIFSLDATRRAARRKQSRKAALRGSDCFTEEQQRKGFVV